MKFSTRSTEKKTVILKICQFRKRSAKKRLFKLCQSLAVVKLIKSRQFKNLFKFSSSRTNKMLSVRKIYSSLAVVELIKCCQFKNLFKFSSSRTNKKLSVQKIYSSLESVELIKSSQFKIYLSLATVKVKQ